MDYKWILFSFLSLFSLVANYLLNKGLSHNYSPLLAMTVTGAAQLVISGALFLFSSEKLSAFTAGDFWMSVAIAVCVLGIDWSMITAYNMGGNSVMITLIVSMATVVMLPISFFWFRERISPMQFLGIALSIVSICLVILFPAKK